MKFSFRQLKDTPVDNIWDAICIVVTLIVVIISIIHMLLWVSPWTLLVIPIGAILRTLYLMKE